MSNQLILSDIQTTFKYNNLDILCIKINEYNIWFKAKEAAEGMAYKDTDQAIRDHVYDEHKKALEYILKLGWNRNNMLPKQHIIHVPCLGRENVASNILSPKGPVKTTGPNNISHNGKKIYFYK